METGGVVAQIKIDAGLLECRDLWVLFVPAFHGAPSQPPTELSTYSGSVPK